MQCKNIAPQKCVPDAKSRHENFFRQLSENNTRLTLSPIKEAKGTMYSLHL